MNLRSRHLLAALAGCGIILGASAGAARSQGTLPPAGPWYTHQELTALNAYSAMSFAQKQALLKSVGTRHTSETGESTPLAGPSYTPSELQQLKIYSNASFLAKKALLGGAASSTAEEPAADRHGNRIVALAAVLGGAILAVVGGLALRSIRERRPSTDGQQVGSR